MNWLQTIDLCLEQRQEIISCLESCRSHVQWLKSDRHLTNLLSRLREGAGANEFVSSDELAVFLPLVLLFAPNRNSASEFNDWIQSYLRQSNRRRTIWKWLSYPVLIPLIYLAILVVMSFTIIPQFRQMFDEFGLRVPTSTKRLFWMCEQISGHPIRTLLGCALLGAGAYGLINRMRWFLDRSHDVPFLGHLCRSSKRQLAAMSRLTATLAELLRVEAPLSEAMRVAGLASGYSYFRDEAETAARVMRVDAGPTGVRILPSCFPSTLIHALQSGPNQKPSVVLIQKLSKIYADRLEQRTRFAQGIVAPAMTIVMAWLIGGIVSSLMIPLISLITSLSG
jgi:type IV pilus assembly protein PilC